MVSSAKAAPIEADPGMFSFVHIFFTIPQIWSFINEYLAPRFLRYTTNICTILQNILIYKIR